MIISIYVTTMFRQSERINLYSHFDRENLGIGFKIVRKLASEYNGFYSSSWH